MEGKPLVWLNVSQADESENVGKVENVQNIDESLISDQMKMPLPEINTTKFFKQTSWDSFHTRKINEERNEEQLQLAKWTPSADDLDQN